ncbi:MAG: hypothetical protein FJZ60_00270 [Chlamydiae bacterium]|nr:hypothetical protein [Chlamydiota bacterium]
MLNKIFSITVFCATTIALYGAKEDKNGRSATQQYENCGEKGRFYAGVYGGGGGFTVSNITQAAIKYNSPSQGGTTYVTAYGGGRTAGVGMAGLQAGYLWPDLVDNNPRRATPKSVSIGTEFEGYYLGTKLSSNLGSNFSTFNSTFPINGGTLLGSLVFHFGMYEQSRYHLFLGGAAGASVLTAHNATSYQVQPLQTGINHFNTQTTATAWTFAAQGKAGLMFDVNEHFKVSGEYRFLYLTPARFRFGSTSYAGHPPTTPWRVKFGNMFVNMGDLGISYYF